MAHDHSTLKFPEGFLWGAGNSAFQAEGNNTNSDWWEWEQKNQPVEKRSGQAANHYNLYSQDFQLLKDLGHNTHRLSVEWSRIEPEEGMFDEAEIEHYKRVLQSLKGQGLTVMLTIHHFTNPKWFADKGGWLNFSSPKYFEKFVKKVIPEFLPYVDLWITINEPGGYALDAYGRGKFPPNKKLGNKGILQALFNLSRAHKRAYRALKKMDPKAKVGMSHNITSFNSFHKHRLLEQITVWSMDQVVNHLIYRFTGIKTHDFLGINYYFNQNISFRKGFSVPQRIDVSTIKTDISDMGWEVRPEGLFDVLMDLSDYNLPIYITENGIASTNDDRRVRFLLSFLKEVYHAVSAGADVRGYYYWSLTDNYEWTEGFESRFGLVEVDFKTQKRTPKPSSFVYKMIIENNGIPHKLLKLLGHGFTTEEVREVLEEVSR